MQQYTRISIQARARSGLAALALLAVGVLVGAAAHAIERVAPQVDASALPEQARTWAEPNPLRGNEAAIALGRSAFNQSCARCHGEDANGSRSPAPDLRRLGLGCRRIQDAALRQRCMGDADAFFIHSVRYGKQKFGIVHMPPWEGVIGPDVAWALRSFIESNPLR
ncbi:hypothetical protein GCM10027019_06860 [Melaminivora jejuensis]|uniref:c-type cytochrome n=1 Tax=Melaminivora jejuensis TaxID=1267217 RepID=UPI001ADFEEE7|nr:c-type cytochrome [Melaminivora jejuensis]UHJ65451.1 c-type cytochrome [Melaminivora jejuensis]